jgi:acetoin utilization deacetylase AcuC-like enzyme
MIAFHPIYVHPLPENHRFPMEKYDLLPRQLLYEGIVEESYFFEPSQLTEAQLLSVHSLEYWEKLKDLKLTEREQRVSGFVHSDQLIERELTIMEGTRKAAEIALETGLGFNIAGGTHHAFYERGEGFCLLNDQVIAAKWLLQNTKIKRVLIIDLDVHQGNGTASLLKDEPAIFTFSMHGAGNYPLKKEYSDLDIELPDACKDKDFLFLLEASLDKILSHFQPDFIFYQSGVDVLESDKLGRLSLSQKACYQRDLIVYQTVQQLKVPVVTTMGGGYSPQIKDIVNAHCNTFKAAFEVMA